jgi:beta-glucosidase/6-phospho-beta-glucosidase/beta-galactosidase
MYMPITLTTHEAFNILRTMITGNAVLAIISELEDEYEKLSIEIDIQKKELDELKNITPDFLGGNCPTTTECQDLNCGCHETTEDAADNFNAEVRDMSNQHICKECGMTFENSCEYDNICPDCFNEARDDIPF